VFDAKFDAAELSYEAEMRLHVEMFPGLRPYVDTVVTPYENGGVDDGHLSAWVNDQARLWRANLERPDGRPEAPEMVRLLELWLSHIRDRVRVRQSVRHCGAARPEGSGPA
jgi:hypothetical protein